MYRLTLFCTLFILFTTLRPIEAQDNSDMVFSFAYVSDDTAILPSGEEGAWDSAFTYAPNIVEHDNTFYMFYSGLNASSDAAVGLATSEDGIEWTRHDQNPIFRHNGESSAALPVVLTENDEWIMLYVGDPRGGVLGPRIYRATAPAPEGPWQNDPEPILESDRQQWDYNIMPRSITKLSDGFYHLLYTGATIANSNQQIGAATSPDGINWSFVDDPSTTDAAYSVSDPVIGLGVEDSWNTSVMATSNMIPTEDGYAIIFMGDNKAIRRRNGYSVPLGYATSEDGIQWEIANDGEPVIETNNENGWSLLSIAQIDDSIFIYLPWQAGSKGIRLMQGTITHP